MMPSARCEQCGVPVRPQPGAARSPAARYLCGACHARLAPPVIAGPPTSQPPMLRPPIQGPPPDLGWAPLPSRGPPPLPPSAEEVCGRVQDVLRRFAAATASPVLFVAPGIPPDKLAVAAGRALVPPGEPVLGLVDLTKKGTAKDALLFAGTGIYYHNKTRSGGPGPGLTTAGPGYLPYAGFGRCRFVADGRGSDFHLAGNVCLDTWNCQMAWADLARLLEGVKAVVAPPASAAALAARPLGQRIVDAIDQVLPMADVLPADRIPPDYLAAIRIALAVPPDEPVLAMIGTSRGVIVGGRGPFQYGLAFGLRGIYLRNLPFLPFGAADPAFLPYAHLPDRPIVDPPGDRVALGAGLSLHVPEDSLPTSYVATAVEAVRRVFRPAT
jgi:hypothetical protein